MDCLGRCAYLLSDWIREPVLRPTEVGSRIFDKAAASPRFSRARESGKRTLVLVDAKTEPSLSILTKFPIRGVQMKAARVLRFGPPNVIINDDGK